MKFITLVSLGALASLSLTACNSKEEEARKAEINAQAEKLDDAAKTAQKEGKTDADVAKKEADAKAEALKAEADKVRDQK